MAAKDSGKNETRDLDEVVEDAALRMMGAVESLEEKLKTVRTGRASPALVEGVRVQCYGTESPIRQVAGIAVPEPRLIMLRPYDPNVIGDIEKAIVAAELGLNPQNDGKVIRIPIPPLTEERRRDLVKLVEREGEAARVAVRNVRRDANREIDAAKKSGGAPEDACFKARDEVQKHTGDQEKEIDSRLEAKKSAVMEV
ncbi:MAG: ribosome recycling factor [Planctomycetota bacterium]|jgi:ribosome recycling factor